MTQALYERVKTKKELKERIAQGKPVTLKCTSLLGNEYDGDIYKAPNGRYVVVGPGEYDRKWYAEISIKDGKITVK